MTHLSLPACATLGLLLASACALPVNLRNLGTDPTVVIHGSGGDELGVATPYGIVFLGRTVDRGRAEFTTWFGDGPSIEEGVVESLGEELCTTSAEIRVSRVPLTFRSPEPGQRLIVRGRSPQGPWEVKARASADPRVQGILLEPNAALRRLDDGALGAGVFVTDPRGRRLLVGLLSGRLRLEGANGTTEFFTVAGPEALWRLVVHRRNTDRPRRWTYREDIL